MSIAKILRRLKRRPAPDPGPRWESQDAHAQGWAELLCPSPLIVHSMYSYQQPVGAASSIGPTFRSRPIHFLVTPCWTLENPGGAAWFARMVSAYLDAHPLHRMTILCNTDAETKLVQGEGINALTINANCLVNDEAFKPLPDVRPVYDAIYIARLSPEKRVDLARDIRSLILVYFHVNSDGSVADFHAAHARYVAMMPGAHFANELTPDGCMFMPGPQVNERLAQARVGLCLSPEEGAMRAAIEYLFAGLPVVSTPSLGGRDYFFDPEFCLIADPDPRAIREAVEGLAARGIPREYIRAKTVARVNRERERLIDFVQGLIDEQGQAFRFADRFWECTRDRTFLHWRSMEEFSALVARADRDGCF